MVEGPKHSLFGYKHDRLINYIDTDAKCRNLKNLTCKGTLRQVFICPRPSTPYPLPPYIMYACIQYVYLFTHRGGGGRVEPERRLEGQEFTKLGRKYKQDCLYLPFMSSDKHLQQIPFTGQFFKISPFQRRSKAHLLLNS
jgi:hypothetical protein